VAGGYTASLHNPRLLSSRTWDDTDLQDETGYIRYVSATQSPQWLPIPPHFDPGRTDQVWQVPYGQLADAAAAWRSQHDIMRARADSTRVLLLLVDMQNTFCLPTFELFVAGRSGHGATDDVRRLCEFIYRNLGQITAISPTMDTHRAMQIFHPIFWIDSQGRHPAPFTLISEEDVMAGRWRVNPEVTDSVAGSNLAWLERYVRHYVRTLRAGGKYDLTVWPYHAMLGGIGHALVSSAEEAIFFHNLVRDTQTRYEIKGDNPLTENYSVLKPEVLDGPDGEPIAYRSEEFLRELLSYNVVIIAGEAMSHCLAWTIDDLLTEVRRADAPLVKKVYLLEDCTSPVVVPGAMDYTDEANAAFARFAAAGMHVVRSTDPMSTWPEFPSGR
jgi:nicotinamidase-related amidase